MIISHNVIGVAHETWGEVGVAFVVLSPGETVSEAQLSEFLQSRLAKYKIPKEFVFTESLPRTPYGKVVKPDLAAAYAQSRKQSSRARGA
jgi:acyl-CoA synthetase (AMP-forming)/AMP-acid ligase II